MVQDSSPNKKNGSLELEGFVDMTQPEVEILEAEPAGMAVPSNPRFQGKGAVATAGATGTALANVAPPKKSFRIGERLLEQGVIDEHQLSVALHEKQLSGKMLGQVLVDLGFITELQLSQSLAEASGNQIFDSKNTIVDADAVALLNRTMASKLRMLPLSITETELTVAMVDPHDVVAVDTLRKLLPHKNLTIKTLVATPMVLDEAIDAAYGYNSDVDAILTEMESMSPEELSKIPETVVYTHPVVRLVNSLVFNAVKLGVSDLHWEPEENFVRLRYRLDGVLYTSQVMHKKHWSAIAQRIKIMSQMNIADKLSPQDGRFELKVGARSADFRVSVLPTVSGENIVMRVLDRNASIMPLERLGFSPHNMERIAYAQKKPEGIIIVTGPTGSGKSTSLYSMINAINDVEVNIQTLEDPVEYSLPMIRQTAVREGVLDFADGIRALLRQDPDIIFIGEIRDGVTAEMALKAAMTGHQVYTTLHTNDSFGAIPRLLDLGLKPGMIAGALIAVFAQRLARRLCPHCRVSYQPDTEICKHLKFDVENPPTIYKPNPGGCPSCGGKGYKGRIALAEILTFDEELDEIIASNGTKQELKRRAVEKGFKSMKDDAILKIMEGVTSYESAASCVDFTR
jgi:type IV pilus assembly protein PilB